MSGAIALRDPLHIVADVEVVHLRKRCADLETRVGVLLEELGGLRYDVKSLTLDLADAEAKRLRDVDNARQAGIAHGISLCTKENG